MQEDADIDPKLLEHPVFQEMMKEGLAMQDRFAAEPVYAKTGKGFLKSVGVEELVRIKNSQRSEQARQIDGLDSEVAR